MSDLPTEYIDMSEGITQEKVAHLSSFLTIRSIDYQQQYAREAGNPEWTDEQIARVYGSVAAAAYAIHKMHQARLSSAAQEKPHEA